jgi:class 3 adenylate cyclase/predicted ATPase
MDVVGWLRSMGLGHYEGAFRAHDIDGEVLPDLTTEDLIGLGVTSIGHRRKLLAAIAALREGSSASSRHTRLNAALSSHDAERRQLTVMFCDLVGSTALSVRLDVEELREIISCYHRRCGEVIAEAGGFVARYLGDGVLAYFGYPHAHENDAERAVRAGLALVDAVAKLDDSKGTALRVRVGIATGLVVVRDVLSDGTAQEQAVIGETPNLAARLQSVAEPDAVVISGNTYRLLGQLFEYRALGSVAVKGFKEPVSVWQVIGVSAVDNRFEALRAITTPLVGRDEEIDLLMRRWEQAKAGEGCIVLVAGESGIGKSRIAQTVVERLGGEPHTRLRYFCSPNHQDSALYPAITQFERAARLRREDTVEQRLDKIEAVLAQATDDPSHAVPLVASLLSIPIGDRYPRLSLNPQKQKEKTLKVLLAQIEGLAAHQPVLIVVEDAHWSDPTSQELFDLLIDRVSNLPVLVIVTFRPEFAPPWVGRPHVTLLTLNRLPPRRRAEMMAHVTGGKVLPPEIAEQIIDRTDGIPLFIEELTKAVIESGVLTDAGDCYTMAGPLPPPAIPTTLNASLLARLDRLAPVREVAQIGAAIGRQFSHELISAVAPIPQQQLNDALDQLVSTELIFRRGSPPDAEYTFKHALVQDAAYSTLLRSRRQQLHGRITNALEDRFPEIVEAHPDALARHCTEAGLADKAIEYWLKAGQQAISRGAMTEAVAQLRKGLNLVSRAPDGEASQERELSLQVALGHALTAAKGYAASEAGEAFARARQLCEQLNRPSQLARVLGGQFAFRLVRGELNEAEHHAEQMRRLGERSGNKKWKAAGSAASGCVCCYLGKFSDARAHYENWLNLWNPTYRTVASTPEDYYVQGIIHLSRTLLCLGYVDQARLRRDEALVEARRLSPYTLVSALCLACYGDWAIGGVDAAHTMLQSAEEILTLSREQGFPLWFGVGNIMRGWCLGITGQSTEGISLILQGLALRRATGSNLLVPFGLMALAEVYGLAAQPEEGLSRLAEAAKVVEATQEGWAAAEIDRLRGTLLLCMHKPAEAEDSYQQSLLVGQRQSAKFWQLRTALDLARLWRDQGRNIEARALLSAVYEWFSEGFDTPVLREARALVEQLST